MTRSLTLVVLLLLSTIASAQQPGPGGDLSILPLPSFEYIGDSNIARGFALIRNRTGAEVRDFIVTVRMEGPRTTYIGGDGCVNTDTPYELQCTIPSIRPGQILPLQLYIGPIHEARVFLHASVSWNGPVSPAVFKTISFPRDFVVTNTGDAGPGTLRDAIERVNHDCVDFELACRIAFHIDQPVPASGWYTIFPNTPLPGIIAPDVEIDGATQTQFGGNTNVLGPEILLDGSALGTGHGLILTGQGFASVTSLAIGGFPWDGIAVLRSGVVGSTIENNYIGTDAGGTQPLPNRSRGITFNRPSYGFEVRHNRITNNVRAGVFFAGAFHVLLSENTISGNSAGVFLGPDSGDVTVEGNYIVENTQFGIAVAPQTTAYRLVDNSITRNGFIGIDLGLDGFSGYDGHDGPLPDAKVPPPRLLSATYDPVADATTITGMYSDAFVNSGSWEITLYRSSVNDGQGESPFGRTTARNGIFTFTVSGDYRGQFITATGFHQIVMEIGPYYWTSEFSEAVEVR
jgi:Right handed beta helix region